ncbi:hypothetical protein CDAR_457991 [Caerostris darwini]|uniref:Uncharacterized protein n=1 Tax=Caerostris darwini TaxID=1538125 RepID=A0AAV4TL54_9ARAC|nr:hypothetical protein CDAR_457991 [Caerostris darwini]
MSPFEWDFCGGGISINRFESSPGGCCFPGYAPLPFLVPTGTSSLSLSPKLFSSSPPLTLSSGRIWISIYTVEDSPVLNVQMASLSLKSVFWSGWYSRCKGWGGL